MKNSFIIAESSLAVSVAGGEAKNRAVAQTEEKTTAPAKQETDAPVNERVGFLFQSDVGDGISYRLAPQIRTEAGAIPIANAAESKQTCQPAEQEENPGKRPTPVVGKKQNGKGQLMKKIIIIITICVLATLVTSIAVVIFKRASAAHAPVTQKNLNKGLVLHMTFDRDETADGLITDSSSGGNNGIPGCPLDIRRQTGRGV